MRSVVEMASLKSPDRGNGTFGLCVQKSDICLCARNVIAVFNAARMSGGVLFEVAAVLEGKERKLT